MKEVCAAFPHIIQTEKWRGKVHRFM